MSDGSRAIAPEVLRRARNAIGSVIGGRYSRGAWAVASLAYLAALALLMLPLSTYLWTSPQPLQELYWAFAVAIALCAAAGLVLTYAKRLHDQNLNGFWAVIPLVAVPWGLIWAATAWADHSWKPTHPVSSTAYVNIAAVAALASIILIGLRRAHETTRFGARTVATDVLSIRHPASLLLATVVAVLVLVSIYAGFFQSGVWVGRPEQGYDTGTVSTSGGAFAFATCGGAKGVSAVSQQGQENGFVRDAIPGTWNIVRLPDRSVDIRTFGKNGNVSYRDDGFTIQTQGLRLDDLGQVLPDVDHFQVFAVSESEVSDVRNVTTISFVKREFGYQAVIASSRVLGSSTILGGLSGGHPRASTFLMIADCNVYQEEPVAAKR